MTRLGHSCQIIPPYLLQELGRTGALPQEVVDATLRQDERFRQQRSGRGSGAATLPRTSGEATPQAAPADPKARWTVHDAQNTEELPGTPVRSEGEPATGDEAVDEAADGITATLNVYRDVYSRDSYDGKGARAMLTVHYGKDYANAFWDGTYLVFGDGDGKVFGRFTAALDVLAHEFSHAVTERTTGLVYQGQSGALNESMSDVFGACVKQWVNKQDAAGGDWVIGDGIFQQGINARGLRDMENPGTAYDDPQLGKDPQPAHMDDFVQTTDDNGGVHINSGIPNRAFVLAAKAIGGTAAEGAGRVWYAALTSGQVKPDSDFAAFAAVTVDQAGDQADAVRKAWEDVGVRPGAAPGESGSPTPAPEGLPTDPAPTPGAPDEVIVRRSGGVTGQTVEGSVDLASDDPRAAQARDLVDRCDLSAVGGSGQAQPDRFVYAVRVGDREVQVPEQDLTPDLAELVALVLRDRG